MNFSTQLPLPEPGALATLHVHLDGDSCMELTALKGSRGGAQHFAEHIIAERGVRYGRVVIVPTNARKRAGHAHNHKQSAGKRN